MTENNVRVYQSMLDMLPGVDNPTPLVRLNRVVALQHAEVYAKLEWYNPFGSVKDRVAASLIEHGDLNDRQRLVEPTSGNTGMGLTMVANARNYDVTTPLSNAIPEEKRTILRFFGATVEELDDDLCPAPWAPEGAIARAHEIAEQPDFEMLNQYANESNPDAHYRTTGPEIWRQTGGHITHFVAGLGTCGTITGTGRFLHENNPDIAVVGVHPAEGHDIPGVRSIRQLKQTAFFKPDEYDGLVEIDNKSAYAMCLRLTREESIPAGPSSGMALSGALQMIPDEPGTIAVVIFPDNAFKYGSSISRHNPELRPTAVKPTRGPREDFLDSMIENTRGNTNMTIGVAEAREWATGGRVIIDVRSEKSFGQGHVPGARNIPLLDLPNKLEGLPEDLNTPILSICQVGNLSLSGVLYLQSLGYSNARSITGGTNAWVDQGWPIEQS